MQKRNSSMRVLSVNVAAAQPVRINDRQVLSAIGKRPVPDRVSVHLLGLGGDEQADLSVHGGLGKAVYAYPEEHFTFWQTVRAQARVSLWDEPVSPGLVGENLTLRGITEDALWIGDRLELPDCVLAVSEPRFPCFKFNAAMGFPQASKMMSASGFCGAYLGVLREGSVGAGDDIRLVPGPREVNLRDLFRARMKVRRD
jgi:MOSC domain-containing protein YiiM